MTTDVLAHRPVVAGFDGSPSGYAAADYAAWLAESRDAPLHLVHGYYRASYSFDIVGMPDPQEVTSEEAKAGD